MRLAINVTREGSARVIEEDIEIALGKVLRIGGEAVWLEEFDITEQDTGCFTADTETPQSEFVPTIGERMKTRLEADTGAEVTVEVFDWDRGY